MDIASYSSDSRVIIKNAREVAAAFKHPEIDIEHLLLATVRHEGTEIESILNQLGKSPSFVESIVEVYLKEQSSRSAARENLTLSPSAQRVLEQAVEEKNKLYDPVVEPEHILIAMVDPKSSLAPYVREKMGIVREDIFRAIAEDRAVAEIAVSGPKKKGAEAGPPARKEVGRTLRYCTDMTDRAAAGEFDPLIGREKEVQQVIQILLRRRKNSPILVGGAGVGKSAIVEGFAQAVVAGRAGQALREVRVMEVDMGAMVAGAKYKGEFEERFKALIGEVVKSAGKVVLFIDEVHTICGAGSGGSGMDAANLIKPALARGQLRLIGATTQEEYTRYLEKDKALDRRFERVKVEPPNFDEAVRVVRGVAAKYEDHHKIKYVPEAMTAAVKFAQRYLSERNLPDVALDIIDEAASEFGVKKEMALAGLEKIAEEIANLEKMIAACEGREPSEAVSEFEKLKESYDDFSRQVARLDEFWGHRVEVGNEDKGGES